MSRRIINGSGESARAARVASLIALIMLYRSCDPVRQEMLWQRITQAALEREREILAHTSNQKDRDQ